MLVRNRSARLITIKYSEGEVAFMPLQEVDVPEKLSKSNFFKALVESEDLVCLNSAAAKKSSK